MNRLKELRREYRLTQTELAAIIKCSAPVVSEYERELKYMDCETINKLCSVFKCSADYLLGLSNLRTNILTEEEKNFIEAYRTAGEYEHEIIKCALSPFMPNEKQSVKGKIIKFSR